MFESIAKGAITMFNGSTCQVVELTGETRVPGTTTYETSTSIRHSSVPLMLIRASSGDIEKLVLAGKVKKNDEVYLANLSKLDNSNATVTINENRDFLVKDGVTYKVVSSIFRSREEYLKLYVRKHEQ